jgi:predicted PurR-regulated permease PerM
MTERAAEADRRLFVRRTLTIAIVLLAVAAVVWLAFRLSNFLFMVFVALFVAIAFEPPVHYLERKGWRRGAATGVVFLVAFALFVLFMWALLPLFVDQVQRLIEAVPNLVESMITFLQDNFGFELSGVNPEQVARDLLGSVQNLTGVVANGVIGIASSVFSSVIFAPSSPSSPRSHSARLCTCGTWRWRRWGDTSTPG